MNIWTKRLLVIVSIGGGFCGMVFMFLLFPQAGKNVAAYFLITGMIATFGFGVFAGVRFIEEEEKGLKLLRWFFAIQIPILSSPVFAYQLSSGLAVNLSWIGERMTFLWRFGSEMGVWILQNKPWGGGVNAFALVMFLWTRSLLKDRAKKPNKAPEPTTMSVTPRASEADSK